MLISVEMSTSSSSSSCSSSICLAAGFTNSIFFDYENEDDKQTTGHFRHLPLIFLHSNYCPVGATFPERSIGKSIAV
jgi:hypothetical protein